MKAPVNPLWLILFVTSRSVSGIPMHRLDRYLRVGTAMKFVSLPEFVKLTPAGIEAWAKADKAD
ncbi:MAG: hypothetical protein V4597_19445 [Pseudomonadota bacterium]